MLVLVDQTVASGAQVDWVQDGGTGKGREDLEKDKTKSKRNGRSGRTPIRTREALFVVLV